jgi:hypothetical protein
MLDAGLALSPLALTTSLTKRGVSLLAARQVLEGRPVTSPNDRERLAQLMLDGLALLSFTHRQQVAMLLPAVQKIRVAAIATSTFTQLLGSPSADHEALRSIIAILIGALDKQGASPQLAAAAPVAKKAAASKVPGLRKVSDVTLKRG